MVEAAIVPEKRKEAPIAKALRGLDNFGAKIARGFIRFYVRFLRRDRGEAELVCAAVSGFMVGISTAFLFTPAFLVAVMVLLPLSLSWAYNATLKELVL